METTMGKEYVNTEMVICEYENDYGKGRCEYGNDCM